MPPAAPAGAQRLGSAARGRTQAAADRDALLLRRMVLLSVGVHLIAVVVLPMISGSSRPLVEPVAVIDLVGADVQPQPPPVVEPQKPPEPPKTKELPRAKEHPKTKEPPKAKEPPPKAVPIPDKVPAKASEKQVEPPPDASAANEAIRKIKQAKEQTQAARDAVSAMRQQADAKAAVDRLRQQKAARIDLPQMPPKSSPSAVQSGSKGTVKVAPEILEFYRKLDERIRSNWTGAFGADRDRRLMVQLVIDIEPDGNVSKIVVESSSSLAAFDESVQRAIYKSTPLPVPPVELRGAQGTVPVGFRFHGAGGP